MKMKFNNYLFVTYILMMVILCYKLSYFKFFDIPYDSIEMLYLMNAGIYIIIILFNFDRYAQFIKEFGAVLVLRYQSILKLYHRFLKECLQQAIIFTILKIVIEYIIFKDINICFEIIFLLVIYLILILHCVLEMQFNSKIALIVMVLYISISLSVGDMSLKMSHLFVLNLIFVSRVINPYDIIIYLLVVIFVLYILSRYILKKKEVY